MPVPGSCLYGDHAWVIESVLDNGTSSYKCAHCGKYTTKKNPATEKLVVVLRCGCKEDWVGSAGGTSWVQPGVEVDCRIHGSQVIATVNGRAERQPTPTSAAAAAGGGCLLILLALLAGVTGVVSLFGA